ncbi:MAG TPA: tetratricopeptide repeat protein [Polyangiales bacterium]|nr:tetratricopeptide repeat protein [Polyangiales bacterium]
MAASALRHPVRRLGRGLARVAIVFACGALVPTVRADDTRGPMHMPPPAALEHYNLGRAHYQAGRYREAVDELEQALTLDPGSPNLVYNLARVYELLGDIDRALPHYEHYRDMLPASAVDERARIDTTLQRLRGARSALLPRPEPERQLRPPNLIARVERGVADGAFWTLASLSLAALAAGGVTGIMALRVEKDSRDFVLGREGDLADRDRRADRADRLALISDVSFAAGAVGGLTSVLLYALRTRTIIEPQASVGPTGFTLGVRGSL